MLLSQCKPYFELCISESWLKKLLVMLSCCLLTFHAYAIVSCISLCNDHLGGQEKFFCSKTGRKLSHRKKLLIQQIRQPCELFVGSSVSLTHTIRFKKGTWSGFFLCKHGNYTTCSTLTSTDTNHMAEI